MDGLILVILTDMRQALMELLYRQSLFGYVCRGSSNTTTFLFSHLVFPAQAPLLPPELPFQGTDPGRLVDIGKDTPTACHGQRFDTQVDTDSICLWLIGCL